jgi:predicted transcriptional regulator
MLAHFVEREDLSPDEVKELEQILARRKNRR